MNSRQQDILQYVIDKQKVSVSELAENVGVSVVTVRHDLNSLEKGNYLKRIHGFAVAIDSEDVDTRMMANFHLKQRLAEYAAAMVEENDTIFIESGSTNALLARILGKQSKLTIITVSAYIANLLRECQCEIILLGGIYQKGSESVVGPLTRQCLQHVHFNKAFMGIDGFHSKTGFTGRDMMRTDVVNNVLQKCAQNIILTDSSKFGKIHSNPLGPNQLIHQVITDYHLLPEYQQQLTELGVSFALVDQ